MSLYVRIGVGANGLACLPWSMLRQYLPVGVLVLSLVGLGGCASSAPDEARAAIPPGSRLIAAGQFDKLVLSAPEGGTVYFVDDRSGAIVYALPYPPNERPFPLAEAPGAFRSMFEAKHSYRIYLASGNAVQQ